MHDNCKDQPLMLERRLVLRTAAALGMSAVLWGCTPDRIATEGQEDELTSDPDKHPSGAQHADTSPIPSTLPSTDSPIMASHPRQLAIPKLKLDSVIDRGINPTPVAYRGDDIYYDPPTNDKIYWADGCALPSSPSSGTTYLFGHSDISRIVGGAVFDNLPQLVQHDQIMVTTALGRFAYQVTQNLIIPYEELAQHTAHGDFGDGSVKDRLVLITCRVPDLRNDDLSLNTVICANQINGSPL